MVVAQDTVDLTFPQLFVTIGQSVAAATLIVSIGKVFTQYYFYVIMAAILAAIGVLAYVDVIQNSPSAKRGPLENYMYSVYSGYKDREVDSALYGLAEQQAKLLVTGTPKNSVKTSRFGGSSTNLADTPNLRRKQKRL